MSVEDSLPDDIEALKRLLQARDAELAQARTEASNARAKPMPEAIARANGKKSKVRAFVEHVFARQKGPMGMFIRTIGLARATTKIGLPNLTYNMKRMIWLTVGLATA